MAPDRYQNMVIDADAAEILYSPYFTGVPGNYLKASIIAAGIEPEDVLAAKVGGSVSLNKDLRPKAWKDIWGAGQGVGAIDTIMSVRELVDQLSAEYEQAKRDVLR
jgi:nitronate monooxygenase